MKTKTVAKLKKDADKVFSQWIRQRDSKLGCITCGSKTNLQNGHFVSRKVSMLRYDEVNCNAQCVGCNMFKYGDLYTYALKLDERYGKGTAKRLHDQRFTTHSFKRQELEDIITKYTLTNT